MGDIRGDNDGIYVQGLIENIEANMLVDTGASVTIVSTKFFESLMETDQLPQIAPISVKLVSASGDEISVRGQCNMKLSFKDIEIPQAVIVAEIKTSCILGLDFLSKNSCDINLNKMMLKDQGLEIPCFSKSSTMSCCKISLTEDIVIPPHCEYIALARVMNPSLELQTGILEPLGKFVGKHEILIPQTLVKVQGNEISVRYLNVNNESVKLYKNTQIATIETAEILQSPETQLESLALNTIHVGNPTGLPAHLQCILENGPKDLTTEQNQNLKSLLLKYQDSFSASSTDKGLTHLVEHKINTSHAPPIKQPPRRIPLAKMEEV